MQILLALLTSTATKYIAILLILVGATFFLHNYVELQKTNALAEYNINQLKQSIKDKESEIKLLKKINEAAIDEIEKLNLKKNEVEKKTSDIEKKIDKKVIEKKDRESSDILKELFKELGNQK